MNKLYKVEYTYKRKHLDDRYTLTGIMKLIIPDEGFFVAIKISKTVSINITVGVECANSPIQAIARHAIKQYHDKVLKHPIIKLRIKRIDLWKKN